MASLMSRSTMSAQQPESGDPAAEVPEAVFYAEKFLASLFDPEAQQEMCSDRMTVEWLHSWPMKKVQSREDFFRHQKAIQRGCPDWDYRACVWRNTNFDVFETDDAENTVVHATIQVRCNQTEMLEIENCMFEPSDDPIFFPKEWVTMLWSNSMPPTLETLVFKQILDVQGCSTGGLAGVPGLMHFHERPLPPPLTEILAPIPPFTAPDNRDPNFKMRIQVFKQIVKRGDAQKQVLKDHIAAQKRELEHHMDYLNSIRNYL